MINRVEPKIAGLLSARTWRSSQSTPGRGHYVFIMHTNTAPFDSKELRLALKYAINREEMVEKILRGYGSVGNDMPINAAYPLFDARSSSVCMTWTKRKSTTQSPVMMAHPLSAHC